MILHFGYDMPMPELTELDAESAVFTPEEVRILKIQIRKNMRAIDDYVKRIDLFVNHERHPDRIGLIEKLRQRLFILMEENDTFRKALWKHLQQCLY
ncbi:MAG TPA: hypothetical protein PLO78_07160 [Candidatus Omnitrophota bacterium]|nr:hypothetical protein [Candidatus Omnitrophota bacterium]